MTLQNIGAGNRDDAFYRYKMPKMITKIEGRGNGIKTNIVNMVDIAKALARPAAYTTKYFGCELGAQLKFDKELHMSMQLMTPENLLGYLKFSLRNMFRCYGCGNHVIEILITKTQMRRILLSTEDLKSKKQMVLLAVDPHETLVEDLKEYPTRGETASQIKTHLAYCSENLALFDALFSDVQKAFAKEVDKKKKYVVAIAYAEGSDQVILQAIESFCGKASLDVVKEVAVALKNLYDADVLDEDAIVEWYEKGTTGNNWSAPIWKYVNPFVEWLQSADSESEEE